jgi:hypothetical protein
MEPNLDIIKIRHPALCIRGVSSYLSFMNKRIAFPAILAACMAVATLCADAQMPAIDPAPRNPYLPSSKPWTRWWWFASVIKEEDVRANLDWLKANNFGGVEVAWVYPLNRMKKDTVNYTPRQEWLSPEWSKMVAYAKRYADGIGLGCDFTFGTLWPFGDSRVPRGEATRRYGDTAWRQTINASWEYPKKGLVLDHLDSTAFAHYASRLAAALPADPGKIGTSWFVDSWEVETRGLWTEGFDRDFRQRFGYDISPLMDSLFTARFADERFDYMSLLSEKALRFYRLFDETANRSGAASRAQCAGAPCNVLAAYASVDIPESEAMLYDPPWSRIPASAAALAGRPIVTAESFTCLYGWPRDHIGEEQTADLKLVADAMFANGVNRIIWHGKPYNPAGSDSVHFYASVHVGSTGALSAEIPAFNKYLEKVSGYLSRGRTYSDAAVYLPVEDAWIAGEYPKEKQFIWSWGAYELRYVTPPEELKGYHPLWIDGTHLETAKYVNGRLEAGAAVFSSLYVDAGYLSRATLSTMLSLAKQGLPVCIKRIPKEPGRRKTPGYLRLVEELVSLPNVSPDFEEVVQEAPLVSANDLFDFWSRVEEDTCHIFFANPASRDLTFPIGYGQSFMRDTTHVRVVIRWNGRSTERMIVFGPYQSLLLSVDKRGNIREVPIEFRPATPKVVERKNTGKEPWKVQ